MRKTKNLRRLIFTVLAALFFLPLLWGGYHVVEDCKAHKVFFGRSHDDTKAITKIFFRDRLVWSGALQNRYQAVIISETIYGELRFQTDFSDGTKRESVSPYIIFPDQHEHYFSIGIVEDTYNFKVNSILDESKSMLSCIPFNSIFENKIF